MRNPVICVGLGVELLLLCFERSQLRCLGKHFSQHQTQILRRDDVSQLESELLDVLLEEPEERKVYTPAEAAPHNPNLDEQELNGC